MSTRKRGPATAGELDMRDWKWLWVLCVCIAVPFVPGSGRAADGASPAPAESKAPPKDLVMRDDAQCTSCHDEADSPEQLAIGKTRHGTRADSRTPTCVTCHGDSKEHIAKLEGQKDRPKPEITFAGQYSKIDIDAQVDRYFGRFGRGTTTSVKDRNDACLQCHQGGRRMHWAGSTHANRDVACTNCHQIHTAHDRVRDRFTQTELCFTCHKEQRAQINRPSHHPIADGKMACADCHNVHGDNPKQLVKSSVNETCFTCHMEKRGPFLHNHQPVQEDCSICHQPHGTTIANLLKSRPPFLCQECHSHTSHPSQLAGLPTARTASSSLLGTVARGCLNCHTNIHGSNSSQNSATAGRFRR